MLRSCELLIELKKEDDDINYDPTSYEGFLYLEGLLLSRILDSEGDLREETIDELEELLEDYSPGGSSWENNQLKSKIYRIFENFKDKLILLITPIVQGALEEIYSRTMDFVSAREMAQIVASSFFDLSDVREFAKAQVGLIASYLSVDIPDKVFLSIMSQANATLSDIVNKSTQIANQLDNYYSTFSVNVLNLTRTYATLKVFNAGNIEKYKIQAVLDEKTTDICIHLDQSEFSVSEGLGQATKLIRSTLESDLKETAPWVGEDKGGFYISQGESRIHFDDSSTVTELTRLGVMFPPFHANCRSTIVPA